MTCEHYSPQRPRAAEQEQEAESHVERQSSHRVLHFCTPSVAMRNGRTALRKGASRAFVNEPPAFHRQQSYSGWVHWLVLRNRVTQTVRRRDTVNARKRTRSGLRIKRPEVGVCYTYNFGGNLFVNQRLIDCLRGAIRSRADDGAVTVNEWSWFVTP